ncbi:MAG TPA: peptidase domain-containing ABC transporter [Coleofasciculaceae cyanobacterium]|jgi:ATP-binding cassette subfamily B protein
MAELDAQISLFLRSFFDAWPFDSIPTAMRKQIALKLRLCSFRPGQFIYQPTELPSAVHCIVQGKVRILGAMSYQSPTLAVAGKGTVIGWDALMRRVAGGSARAALGEEAEILTVAIPADVFESLALQHLMPALAEQVSLSEIFDTLSCFLASMPSRFSGVNLKDVVQYIEQEQLAVVQHWYPDRPDDFFVQPSADQVWLVSGGAPVNLAIGTPVTSPQLLQQIRPSLFPVRLLGIERSFLASALLSGAIPTDVAGVDESRMLPGGEPGLNPPPIILHDPNTGANNGTQNGANGVKNGGTLPPPNPATSALSRAFKPVPGQSSSDVPNHTSSHTLPSPGYVPGSAPNREAARTHNYPIRRSPVPEVAEDAIACFGMVCELLQVPYRPDSLRKLLKQRSLEEFEPLDLCMRIGQAVGLNAQVTHFTPTIGGLNRLSLPAIVRCHDILTVIYEVTATGAIVGSPRTGLLRLSADQLASRLTPDAPASLTNPTPTCEAVTLERLPRTPTKRFGFSWFIPMLAAQGGILTQVLVASVFIQVLGLANPLLVQQVIDKVIINANIGVVPMFGMLLISFAFLEGVLTILRMYLFASTTTRLDLRLSIEIVRHLLRLPLSFFDKRPVGELSSRLDELENIRQFLTGTALTGVLDVIFSVMYIGVMFLYSPTLTLCVLLTIPVIVLSTLAVASVQKKLIRVKSDHGAKVQSYLIEVLNGMFTVKAQNMESLVEATWRDRYVNYLGSGFTTATVSTIFGSFNQFLNTTSSFLVLWVGASLVLEGKLSLGGLIAFRILAGYVTGPMIRLAGLWQRFQETSLSMELLADIADSTTEELPEAANVQMPLIQGRVQYCDITFGFAPGQQQLSNVSLDIPAGSFVGVVGQSGSGKSTLMKLLPRLYVPNSGSIYIDGFDVNKVKLDSLRHQLGYVPQDAVLFEGTIRDNIALFSDLSDDAVIEAARIADAHEFIMQLPQGYSTKVGERGGTLSGGQRQRIAIARTVATDPRLLVFDEATSALDFETERRVFDNLMHRFSDRTVFFITHRLNTLTKADWIVFMESGIVVEQGTHQDLMMRRQLYYCLYAQQSRL